MPIPYFLMIFLNGLLAMLAALNSSLVWFDFAPWFNGLRWMRVHFITLGILVEIAFGILPGLVTARAGLPRPKTRWDIWLALNAGMIILLVGIPLVNAVLIIVGGILVFIAATLLLIQLMNLRPKQPAIGARQGRNFYIVALGYLLLGIFLGTGMWLGWGEDLGLLNTKEVHVHANLWGFAAMVFAGLLIDLYPRFARRPLAWPRSIYVIFWLMTIGALSLVFGPWVRSNLVSTLGLILHTTGTVWLLANIFKPLVGDRSAWMPGVGHLLAAYVWFLIPTAVAPLIVLNSPGFPVAEFESNGGPILIYGWVLQVGYSVVPYLFARVVLPDRPAKLGGTWFSLVALNVGAVLFWLGLFISSYQALLHGIAFAAWALSMTPLALSLWRTLQSAHSTRSTAPQIAGPMSD